MAPWKERVAVIGTAGYCGVMLTIGVGLGGVWMQRSAAQFASHFEAVFPFLAVCISLTLVPGLLATVMAMRAAQSPARRRMWRNALVLVGISIVITVVYHVPANLRIWSGGLNEMELAAERSWWLAFHAMRFAAACAAVVVGSAGLTRGAPTSAG